MNTNLIHARERVIKMLRLATNPGTREEGQHALKLAKQWIEKYQLDKADLTESESFHCAEYEIQVRLNTEAWQGADKVFQSSCNTWIRHLAIKVADLYSDFVKGFTKKEHLFDRTWFSVVFVGVEEATWSATDLFSALFQLICHYTKLMVHSGRYHTIRSIESYAIGLVNGISAGRMKRPLSQSITLENVRERGRALISAWMARKCVRMPPEGSIKKLDAQAHQDGQTHGARVKSV